MFPHVLFVVVSRPSIGKLIETYKAITRHLEPLFLDTGWREFSSFQHFIHSTVQVLFTHRSHNREFKGLTEWQGMLHHQMQGLTRPGILHINSRIFKDRRNPVCNVKHVERLAFSSLYLSVYLSQFHQSCF